MIAGVGSYCTNGLNNDFDTEIEIGNYTSIGRDFYVLVGSNAMHAPAYWPQAVTNSIFADWGWDYHDPRTRPAKLTIGHDVWVGGQVCVVSKNSIKIGNGSILGARAVVTKDVPPYAIVGGNPARIIKFRFSEQVIDALEKIAWWQWPQETVKERAADFKDIEKFLQKYLPTA